MFEFIFVWSINTFGKKKLYRNTDIHPASGYICVSKSVDLAALNKDLKIPGIKSCHIVIIKLYGTCFYEFFTFIRKREVGKFLKRDNSDVCNISPLHNITNLYWELDMCLWNTDAPGGNKVKYGKNL